MKKLYISEGQQLQAHLSSVSLCGTWLHASCRRANCTSSAQRSMCQTTMAEQLRSRTAA